MNLDPDGYTLETYRRVWYIETGYCDGNGMGYWMNTKESIRMVSKSFCETLRDRWIEEGKLVRMHSGELRPNFSYGLFRIRSDLEAVK